MEKSAPETAAAAAEVAARFRSLVDTGDIGAIRQTQHLMYVGTASPPFPLSLPLLSPLPFRSGLVDERNAAVSDPCA